MIEQKTNIKHLELLAWLGHVFRKGISPGWLEILATNDVTMYPDGVIAHTFVDGVCYINSGTRANAKFSRTMQKDIVALIKNNSKVVLQSYYPLPSKIANNLKLRYNCELKFYSKGDL